MHGRLTPSDVEMNCASPRRQQGAAVTDAPTYSTLGARSHIYYHWLLTFHLSATQPITARRNLGAQSYPILALAVCRRETPFPQALWLMVSVGMSRSFKTVDYDAALDLTVRLGDCLPPDHLACFVVDSVALLDLSALYARYGTRGDEPYARESRHRLGLHM